MVNMKVSFMEGPPWMTSIEQKILACSTELNPDPNEQRRLRRTMSHDMDVDHLINMAIKEGLAGLLYKNLMKSGMLETLDHQQRERLQSLYYQAVVFNLKLIHDLKEVLHLLNQKNIQVVLLQGIALLQQIYDDIGLRPMTDIDLWVLKKDYPGLIGVLRNQGYQRDPIYPNTFRKGSTAFDLHTHLLGADRIRTRTLLIEIAQEDIFHQPEIIHFEGQKALCLKKYDQVLFLSLHALKHSVSRLIWLVDIKGLISDWKTSDWKALMHRAEVLGQERAIAYVCFLLVRLFDFDLPFECRQLSGTDRLSILEKKVLNRRIDRDCLRIWAPFILLSAGKPLHKRIAFFTENLFPRPEILRQVFPYSTGSPVWQLYLKRVLQISGMLRQRGGRP